MQNEHNRNSSRIQPGWLVLAYIGIGAAFIGWMITPNTSNYPEVSRGLEYSRAACGSCEKVAAVLRSNPHTSAGIKAAAEQVRSEYTELRKQEEKLGAANGNWQVNFFVSYNIFRAAKDNLHTGLISVECVELENAVAQYNYLCRKILKLGDDFTLSVRQPVLSFGPSGTAK